MENKPDIIIKNKKEKTCIGLLLDLAMPVDRTVKQKEAEKK
jgi:hypothetical protein